MSYHTYIDINEARINYELRSYGMATIIVPSDSSQDEIDDALRELARFGRVKVDVDGDIIITTED